jgi:hypothetical protein
VVYFILQYYRMADRKRSSSPGRFVSFNPYATANNGSRVRNRVAKAGPGFSTGTPYGPAGPYPDEGYPAISNLWSQRADDAFARQESTIHAPRSMEEAQQRAARLAAKLAAEQNGEQVKEVNTDGSNWFANLCTVDTCRKMLIPAAAITAMLAYMYAMSGTPQSGGRRRTVKNRRRKTQRRR